MYALGNEDGGVDRGFGCPVGDMERDMLVGSGGIEIRCPIEGAKDGIENRAGRKAVGPEG